mgnify:CR=1 FL=1
MRARATRPFLLLAAFLPTAHSFSGTLATAFRASARHSLRVHATAGPPEDEKRDPTVDIPEGASLKDMPPKGPGAILSGLPWWFPLAIGWFLAPAVPASPLQDIFAAPTAQQEKQLLREERAVIADPVREKALERELYGN